MLPGRRSTLPASSLDTTVIPESISPVRGHDMLFPREKGQAKSRLMRSSFASSMSDSLYRHSLLSVIEDLMRRSRQLASGSGETAGGAGAMPGAGQERYAERSLPHEVRHVIGEIDRPSLRPQSMATEEALTSA